MEWTEVDQIEPKWAKQDQIAMNSTEWTEYDQTGLNSTKWTE